MTADPSAHRSILSPGWAAFGSPARCHNKRPEAGRRGNDVCLRNFRWAHKGWTLLPVSHWGSAQDSGSRHEPRTEDRYPHRTFILKLLLFSRPARNQSCDDVFFCLVFFSGLGHEVGRQKRQRASFFCPGGRSHSGEHANVSDAH